MAEANQNPAGNPGAPGSAGSSGTQRKIAGKFDTLEEAVEKGYAGLEKANHETREEISAIKQLLEQMATAPIGSRGRDDGYDQGYTRGREAPQDDDIDPAEFLSSPGKVLKRREEIRDKRMMENMAKYNQALISNATTVLQFQMKNPDLDEHEELVESFLRKTNQRDPLSKRLREAGKATREYLGKLKGNGSGGGDAGRSPEDDEFVEGPSGNASGRQNRGEGEGEAGKGGGGNQAPSPDDELASEIQERRQWKSSRFQAKASR